ncbi:MAG: hypothetical protein WDA27_07345 [Actinomycetota bacterium]
MSVIGARARVFRTLGLAAVAALVLTACAAPTGPSAGYGSGVPSPRRSGGSSAASPARVGPSPTAARGTGTGVASSTPSSRVYQDSGGVGEMARSYLRASPARALEIQVAYTSGSRPSQAALDHVLSILRREADKPGGITLRVGPEFSPTSDAYSIEEIGRLERRYRTIHSSAQTATMWIVYLNGTLQGDDSTLGVAYEASGAAIFADQISSASTSLVQPGAIERSVLTHEVGHLLALVNLGYTSKYAHEDPDHRYHSRYQTSVMFWAIEDISIGALLSGGPPDDFDRYDLADLALLRSE